MQKIEKFNIQLKFTSSYAILNMCCCRKIGILLFNNKVKTMSMNYNKLWKLLIDRNMIKKDLREQAGLTTNVIAKMGKGGDVSTEVLRKICIALDCKIEDIVEVVTDEE